MNIVKHTLHNTIIGQNENGYINATALSKAYFNATKVIREPRHWLALERTKSTVAHLSIVSGIPLSDLIQVVKGGFPENQGTWIHPKLAVRFGIWLSDEFGYAIEEIISTPTKTRPAFTHAFIERAMLNRPALKDGYFSIIDQVSDKLIAGLEAMGCQLPNKFYPDISVGILWAKYLKSTDRSPQLVGAIKYKHHYQDGRAVDAWQYPDCMYSEFHKWLRSKWMKTNMPKYLDSKDTAIMPLAITGIHKHFLPSPL